MQPDFQQMGIYVDGRVGNELNELLKEKTPEEITARDLYHLSCMHYLNDEPLSKALEYFGVGASERKSHNILDFGSGFAGDARVLADEYGCNVTCVELQPHIHAAAAKFTSMLGLQDRCKHECANIFNDKLKGAPFSHVYSILVILHIPDRNNLWRSLAHNMHSNGTIFIEDYFARKSLTEEDKAQLAGPVACPYLPTKGEYIAALEAAGFVDIEWEDMNDQWLPFVTQRLEHFRSNRERNLRVHGEALVAELDVFYSTVHGLFKRGNLGGVRLRARKA